MDFRIEWLRDRLSSLLGVQEREYTEPVIIQHYDQIKSFFDDPFNGAADLERRILFIHRTFYDRMVEKEVVVMESGTCPASIYKIRCSHINCDFFRSTATGHTATGSGWHQRQKGKEGKRYNCSGEIAFN